MMRTPSVSVVIPTYERNELLRLALRSVGIQDYDGPLDAVVVDNSQDGTAEPIVDDFPFATYYRQQDYVPRQETGTQNAAASRDIGIAVAESDYIHFLDDDDELRRGAISKKLEAIQETSRAKAAYNVVEKFDGDIKYVPDEVVGNELAFALKNTRTPSIPSALLVDRDILLDCEPTRVLPHCDIGMSIEIFLRTSPVYVDEPLTRRNQQPSVARSAETVKRRLRTYERYTGLRKTLLSQDLQKEAQKSYEELRDHLGAEDNSQPDREIY